MAKQHYKANLPERDFFSIEDLTERWDCKENTILQYIQTEKLAAFVRSYGWHLESDTYEGDNPDGSPIWIPIDNKLSSGELLLLCKPSLEILIHKGQIINPIFICDTLSESLTSFSNPNPYGEKQEVIIYIKDIVFPSEEIKRFELTHSIWVRNEISNSGYRSPYMKLMDQAIHEFGITERNQPKKESLAYWFQEKEVNGEPLSKHLAQVMATLVRLPNAQKGRAFMKG